MKKRNGFVSNSSSSSFIMCFPKDFNVETYIDERENFMEDLNNRSYEQYDKDFVIEKITKLIDDDGAWGGDDYELFELATVFEKDFILASVEGGPDADSIELIDGQVLAEKLKKLGYEGNNEL